MREMQVQPDDELRAKVTCVHALGFVLIGAVAVLDTVW